MWTRAFTGLPFFVLSPAALAISASSSTDARKLEINILPVEDFSVGVWSDSGEEETAVAVCYYDGTADPMPPEGAGCAVGFSHASILYTVEMTDNNGVGSRIGGSFSTTVMNTAGVELQLTEGTFDVLHK